MSAEQGENNSLTGLEVAVIGMAGRFPGADHIDEFWENLEKGVESISFFKDDELIGSAIDPALVKDPDYVKARGVLGEIEFFDYAFFDYSPREAHRMDPQFRLLHECVWHALEDALCDPFAYPGAIGFYVGSLTNLLWLARILKTMGSGSEQYETFSLNDRDFLSTRISYKLNLRGPSFTLQTACSTSLVAIHLACQGLLAGECDMALAGGVSIFLPSRGGYLYQEGMIKSPDGHCRVFDAAARGTNGGDGVGIVALKRLKEAGDAGDPIRAVIKGSAINNDGLRKVGYTAPSVEGQAEVIRAALQMAEVDPETIGYVETHGTGTVLGDPIEFEGLRRAFNSSKRGFCTLGSLKGNMGHLDAAAGVAGFIKTVLVLEHRRIPPLLHFQSANPAIDLEQSPFTVNTGSQPWNTPGGHPRRAGISSFGIGGSNCHVILEEAPVAAHRSPARDELSPPAEAENHRQLLVLSARSRNALERMTRRLGDFFRENPGIHLADAAYSLQRHRRAFEYRRILSAAGTAEAADILTSGNPEKMPIQHLELENPRVAFLFPGQGSQYVNMGRELYRSNRVFRQEMDRCFDIMNALTAGDAGEILFPQSRPAAGSGPRGESSLIYRTDMAQPLLFAFEYALAKTVAAWGITPFAMIGHSLGEYTAACLAGVFSPEDALNLVVLRGQLIQQQPGGAMLGVACPAESIQPLLGQGLSLAAENTPERCVVAGDPESVKALEKEMARRGVETRYLHTSHAFHSAMMEPVLQPFEEGVASVTLQPPQLPYISSVSGDWITVDEAVSPRYWARHLRSTVRFSRGLQRIFEEEAAVLVEIGPGRVLSTLARQHNGRRPGQRTLHLIRHPLEKTADTDFLLNQVGQLWLWGIDIDWLQFHDGRVRPPCRLPAYAFDRHFFSVDTSVKPGLQTEGMDLIPETVEDISASPNQGMEPENDTEQAMAAIIKETLGIAEVGILEDFFALGGDSLKAVTLAARINRVFHVRFPLKEILGGASVRAMAALVKSARKEKYEEILPLEKRDAYPLSSAQKRLFFLDRFETIGTSYNMPGVLRINGRPRRRRIEEAFRQLIARHEILRTSFHCPGDEPVQRVHDPEDFAVEYRESTSPDKSSIDSLIFNFIRPFDLSQPPLLRAALVTLSAEEHLLLLDIHHIAADGTSVATMVREFARLYDGQHLPPCRIYYRDFACWQNRWLESGKIREQEEYWMHLLADIRDVPRLNLPLDYDRPPVFSFEGRRHGFDLDPRESAAFRGVSENSGATLYMNLLAAFNVLLYRYTGREDIIVGSGVAGRRHASLSHLIGLFVNMLAMRNSPVGDKSYREFLLEMKAASLAAFDNQDVQLENLIDRLNLQREPSRHPLFDVSFALQNFEMPSLQVEGLTITPYPFENRTSKFDMTLFAFEEDDRLHFQLEYGSRLFKPDTVERLAGHFINIIRQVNDRPDIRLGEIDLLDPEEKNRLLYLFNDTTAAYPVDKTIHGLFEDQVDRVPHWVALVGSGPCQVTYLELERRANRLAAYLRSRQGVEPDKLVGIWMDIGSLTAEAIFGILKAGGAYIPIDPGYPPERKKIIIDDTGINLVISEKRHIKWLNRLQWECAAFSAFLCLDSRDIYAEEEEEPSELMDEELWRYVGETAVDDITGGGWTSSYTGLPLSRREMDEYGDNIVKKLTPILHPRMRILEIGCASGISMFRLAPQVGCYHGTDLSDVIIEKNRRRVLEEGHDNIELSCLAAHDIDRLGEDHFDLVIINSVIQCFPGHNYLRSVIRKAASLLRQPGHIFIGDVMNRQTRAVLVADLKLFQRTHPHDDYNTKTDFSQELFVSPQFFEDLTFEVAWIGGVEISDKIHTIENELTKFRYDVLLEVDRTRRDSVKGGAKNRHQYDAGVVQGYSGQRRPAAVVPGNPAYMIYTSGSTGRPKGVLVDHRGAVNTLSFRRSAYEMGPALTCLQLFSFSFDGFVTGFFTPLTSGSKVVLLGRDDLKDPARIREVISKDRVQHFICVPALFRALLENLPPADAAALKVVTLAGDRLPPDLLELSLERNRHLEIVNEYGITETSVLSTMYRHQEQDNRIRIGAPIANSRIYIMGPDRRPQPLGVPGELFIGGAGLARGYLNNPELTSVKFIANPTVQGTPSSEFQLLYRTGDLARWLPDGHIEYLGRIDHQVKIRGFRIETAEIEKRLEQHDEVKMSAVTVRTDKNGEKYLCAYVVPVSAASSSCLSADMPELRDFLQASLPDYMVPAFFVPLEEFPLTSSGKVNRQVLPDPQPGSGTAYLAPKNSMEKRLAAVWSEILGVRENSITSNANFFELGGHSLRATLLISRIHQELDIRLPLEEIFKTPTLRGLSEILSQAAGESFISLQPVEEKEYYPLASAQKRLYIVNRLDRESTAYNMPVAVMLEGRAELPKLEETFGRLLRRHESLRTSFAEVAGEPVQRIHRRLKINKEFFDFQNALEEQEPCGKERSLPDNRSIQKAVSHFVRPFDLSMAPLLRIRLIRWASALHILMVDMHHIVSDGISMARFIEEFMMLYGGAELPPLRVRYRDYVAWQKLEENRDNDDLKGQREFWLNEFSGPIPRLELPLDHPRPAVQNFSGRTAVFTLESEQVRALRDYAGAEESTLYILLLSIFAVWLARLSGREDIVVGSPASGRRHADLEPVVGMFVNTLALRAYPDSGQPFKEFFKSMTARTLQFFKNQDFQFEELVERVTAHRDTGRNPLFDVMFVLQNMDVPRIEIPGLILTPFRFDPGVAKFDLTLQAVETGEELDFTIEYACTLFEDDTILRFIDYFKSIAAAVLAAPGQKLAEIDILSEEEKARILVTFNRTEADFPRDCTIHQLFEDQVAGTPDRCALICGIGRDEPGTIALNRHLSYNEFNLEGNRLADGLQKRGVRPYSVVGLHVERSLAMMIGIFGILKAGAAYMPIAPDYPAERVRFMRQESGACLVLNGDLIEDDCRDNRRPSSRRPHRQFLSGSAASPAYLIYTSGSTGRPKGVLVNHRSLVNRLNWMQRRYPLSAADTLLQKTPYTFDVSVWELLWWPLGGSRLCLLDPGDEKNPRAITGAVQRSRVTVIHFVPSMLNTFLDYLSGPAGTAPLASLNQVVASGETLAPSQVKRFNRLFTRQKAAGLANLYGPTEAAIDVSFYDCPAGENIETVPIGRPIDNIRLLVLGKGGGLQPPGVSGELYIGGVGLARGYLNNPELTADKFILSDTLLNAGRSVNRAMLETRLYRTGDLCRRLGDGNIEYLGRIDSQVKIRGYRIEPGEIEAQLIKHPALKEAVVAVRRDRQGDPYLAAYGVAPAGRDTFPRETDLREFLSRSLPAYMIPAFFIRLERIPLNPHGKVDRNRLPEPRRESAEQVCISPRNGRESRLRALWADILAIEEEMIGIDANFFVLGGHSLKANILLHRIHGEFRVHLSLGQVFRGPTIRDLARLIQRAEVKAFHRIEPVSRREYYSLSSAQKRLFFLDRFGEGGTAYHMTSVFEIRGRVESGKVENTIRRLIDRHEPLRTSFRVVDDEPVQIVHDRADFAIQCIETAGTGEAEREFIRPFNLSAAPLLRAGLVKVAHWHYRLLFDMHHIISDGLSSAILVRDFSVLYAEQLLPMLRIQYKDFCHWQSRLFRSPEIQIQEAYWLEVFSGDVPLLHLPTDFPRPLKRSYSGRQISMELSAEETAGLKETALDRGTTMFMLLLAACYVWLSRISGQEEIVVGTPSAGRRHRDLESIIGMFANTLALRNFPCGDKVFEDFLLEVKTGMLEANENQDFQFEELVDRLRCARDTGRQPLFDVMFSLQELETERVAIPGLNISPLDFDNRTAKFDLTVRVTDRRETLSLTFEYSTDLFRQETVERFVAYYRRLLSRLKTAMEMKIRDIEILPEEEKQLLLYGFNHTAAAYPRNRTLHSLFEKQAVASPGRLALFFHDRQVTYGELNRRSDRLARRMRRQGIKANTIVGLLLERSVGMIETIMAVLKAGAAYLPLDPDSPEERRRFMLNDSGAAVLNSAEKPDQIRPEKPTESPPTKPAIEPAAELAYVIYTSGSTGHPKGVLVTHGNAVNVVCWFGRQYRLDNSTRLLQLTDYTFDASVNQIFGTLLHGAVLGIVEEELTADMERLFLYMTRYRINIINFVPFLLKELLTEREVLRDLRLVISGGERLDEVVKNSLISKGYRLINHYGPTETTIDVLMEECSAERVTLGRPIANARCYLLDRYGRPVPLGARGELFVGGDGVARGYLNNPDLTAARFTADSPVDAGSGRLFRSGDVLRWLPDGRAEFIGRLDHQVKLRGYRIELGEIEIQLRKHAAVENAVVAIRQDKGENRYLCAYIVSRPEQPAGFDLSSQLRDFLSLELPGYMIPSCFVSLSSIPVNTTGKVDRRALPEPPALLEERTAPTDPLQIKLAAIWSGVLNIDPEQISIHHNFFELGGHSLKATLLSSRIHRELNVRVPLEIIFRNSSLRELADYIKKTAEQAGIAEGYRSILPVEKREYYDVSHSQKRVWIMSQFDGGSLTFNMPGAYLIEGPLVEKALERAFKLVVRRHESLRTLFIDLAGEPWQRIVAEEENGFKLETLDFRKVEPADLGMRIRYQLQADVNTPFDLAAGPLLRARLIRLGRERNLLMFCLHHIISDALSMEVAIGEIVAHYLEYLKGPALQEEVPASLRIHYKDFTAWQARQFDNGALNTSRDYWLRQLHGPLSPLELPLDRERPEVKTYDGDTVELYIDGHLIEELLRIGRHCNATLFMIILAILDILFYRLTGQTDIIVGTPIAGRQHADLEGQIGFYLNTLALRVAVKPDDSFRDLLERVRTVTTAAYEHQAYPFDKLVDDLGLQRDSSRHPLFDVMVDMIQTDTSVGGWRQSHLEITPYGRPLRKSKFDLTVYVFDSPDSLRVEFDFNTDLFDRETVTYISDSFHTLINSIIENPRERVSDLVMDDDQNVSLWPALARSED